MDIEHFRYIFLPVMNLNISRCSDQMTERMPRKGEATLFWLYIPQALHHSGAKVKRGL